jgi:hypothetical protein
MEQSTSTKPKGFLLPLIALVLPFVLFLPYHWFIFDSPASGHIVTLRLEEDHRRTHLFVFWLLTFGPFTIVCFLTSLVSFILRLRRRKESNAA